MDELNNYLDNIQRLIKEMRSQIQAKVEAKNVVNETQLVHYCKGNVITFFNSITLITLNQDIDEWADSIAFKERIFIMGDKS